MEQIIYHIDVNSAFLSWTAAHRINNGIDSIDLRTIPSVIGGDQSKRHGIVLAKSLPAKRYGIITGEPLISAKQKCPHLIMIPPDYPLYVTASRTFMKLLKTICPKVEPYSIDESWMDMTGLESLYGSPMIVAEELKNRVYKELGFTVNIGVAHNKLLAKIASDFKKPNYVHSLFDWEIEEKLWPLPTKDLFYVGKKTEKKLDTLGIHTIGELAKMDRSILYSHLKKPGLQLHDFANGIYQEDILALKPNKGYGNSMTVPYDVVTLEQGSLVLRSLCETIGMRLRTDHVKISCISVSITTNEFVHSSFQKQIPITDSTLELHKAAFQLFSSLWNQQVPLRQIRVHTTKVSTAEVHQLSVFDGYDYGKLQRLDQAIDKIRGMYGEESVMRACFLNQRIGHMSGGIDKEKRTGITKPA